MQHQNSKPYNKVLNTQLKYQTARATFKNIQTYGTPNIQQIQHTNTKLQNMRNHTKNSNTIMNSTQRHKHTANVHNIQKTLHISTTHTVKCYTRHNNMQHIKRQHTANIAHSTYNTYQTKRNNKCDVSTIQKKTYTSTESSSDQ